MKLFMIFLAVALITVEETHGQMQFSPYCKGRKIDKTCYCFSFFAIDTNNKKNRRIVEHFPTVDADITSALNCGMECQDRAKTNCGQGMGTNNAQLRNCSRNETVCSILLANQDAAEAPAYPPIYGTEVSQPQCKQIPREVKWIYVDNLYCKVVKKDQEKAHLKISDCTCNRCCANPYYISKKCRPNGFALRTFCVYCPFKTPNTLPASGNYDDLRGEMKIVSRYLPSCCTCNTEWCSGW